MQTNSQDSQHIAIELEIVAEDEHDADPAAADALGRAVITSLKQDGYTVQPMYTGTRGLSPVEIIALLQSLPVDAWAHRDVLDALSALCTIFTAVVPVAKHVLKAHEKRTAASNQSAGPIKITTEIDGVPIAIEGPDLESVEGALKLAKRFQAEHPAAAGKVTLHSKVKVKGSMPKSQPRRRR